jgi:hypothetical protein
MRRAIISDFMIRRKIDDNDDNVINSKRLATATVIKLEDEDDSNFDESDSDIDNNK